MRLLKSNIKLVPQETLCPEVNNVLQMSELELEPNPFILICSAARSDDHGGWVREGLHYLQRSQRMSKISSRCPHRTVSFTASHDNRRQQGNSGARGQCLHGFIMLQALGPFTTGFVVLRQRARFSFRRISPLEGDRWPISHSRYLRLEACREIHCTTGESEERLQTAQAMLVR